MTFDQKIQLWMTIGTWLASIGTITAVGVAIWLSQKSSKVRLKVNVGIRDHYFVNDPPILKNLGIGITNIGERPVIINSVGWAIGRGMNEKRCLQFGIEPLALSFPMELGYGKSVNLAVSSTNHPNWLKEFSNEFIGDLSASSLKSLRLLVDTSVGKIVKVRPEKGLLDALNQAGKSSDDIKSKENLDRKDRGK
jgi:hypothetical protein